MCNVERCADDIDDCCLVCSRVNGGYIANSSVGCYPGTCSISSSRDVAKKLVNGSILQLRYRFPSRFKTHIQHLSFSAAMKPIKDDGFTNAHALHIKGCSRSKQYGTISARLKTGCSHSAFQIRGSLYTSQHVLASANATFEKLLKQTSCMTCLKRQIKACSCGERNGQGSVCANFATSSFSIDVCVSVGSFCCLSSSVFWCEFASPLRHL